MKKFVSTLLALVLCLSLTTPTALAYTTPRNDLWTGHVSLVWTTPNVGLNNFQRARPYYAGVYSDVPAGAWYEGGIQTLYETGLLEGGGAFHPNSYMTLRQVVSLAVRIHSIYHNWVVPRDQSDLDYALTVGIITPFQYDDYDDLATRRSFAAIMANALPSEALWGINTVIDNIIPDVPAGSPGAQAIYTLYRAGILLGRDSLGSFRPDELITRAAAVVAAGRMIAPSQRQGITLFAGTAAGVILNQSTMALTVGQSAYLSATVVPETAPNKNVTWTSSHPWVASVDSGGRVTGLTEGTTVITATAINGVYATCTVGVDTAPLSYSGTGFYADWLAVPDFGALAKTAPVRVERSSDHTAYYYALDSFDDRDLAAYGEKVISAGFLLDDLFDSGEGYPQMAFRKAGNPLRNQMVTYGQVGNYFVVRPGRVID